jgi:hypothetical protein
MVINTSKSVCMVFFSSNPSKIVAKSFPQFHVGLVTLQFVSSFKYLGHRISANGSDDDDIQREICNMFMRVNVLIFVDFVSALLRLNVCYSNRFF